MSDRVLYNLEKSLFETDFEIMQHQLQLLKKRNYEYIRRANVGGIDLSPIFINQLSFIAIDLLAHIEDDELIDAVLDVLQRKTKYEVVAELLEHKYL